ncbi:MAG: hypothetical protein NTW14_11670 [bacterium]|nr:hypothetical protein [bacterium]
MKIISHPAYSTHKAVIPANPLGMRRESDGVSDSGQAGMTRFNIGNYFRELVYRVPFNEMGIEVLPAGK